MSKRLLDLRQRRAELLVKISSQREQIIEFGKRYHGPLALADKSWLAIRFVYRRPLLAGALTMLLIARGQGMMGLVRTSWKIWKGYRVLKGVAGKLVSTKDSVQRA